MTKTSRKELNDHFKREAIKYLNPEYELDTGTLTDKNRYFQEMELDDDILQALNEQGFRHPTPIQIKTIPVALKGRDILATAQTGSGKTAAFCLPIIHMLNTNRVMGKPYPRALILSPTRELADQIGQSIKTFAEYTRIRQVTIYGGVSQIPQVRLLKRGREIIVATPGRLLDLINQGVIMLDQIETLVLDEADRILDMGFIDDIRKIIRMIPNNSQIMMFSATMPSQIQELADQVLIKPKRISVNPSASVVATIDSYVFFVEQDNKFKLLLHTMRTEDIGKLLIFMKTKNSANRLVNKLKKEKIESDTIHGDRAQNIRERVMKRFKNGEIKILVATDVAARGIDVNDITHIINYDMSAEAETYIHRVGRTGRAGKSGIAYNFCSQRERHYLVSIEKLIKKELKHKEGYPYMSDIITNNNSISDKRKKQRRRR